jgi:hypothetical protein
VISPWATTATPFRPASRSAAGLPRDVAQALVDSAHRTCPYSKALNGNIPVGIHAGLNPSPRKRPASFPRAGRFASWSARLLRVRQRRIRLRALFRCAPDFLDCAQATAHHASTPNAHLNLCPARAHPKRKPT